MSSVVLLLLSALALASFTPTAPGPGDTFAAGSPCTIEWNADPPGGKWKDVSIYLMTGPNDNMTRLSTVISHLDGTDSTLSPYNTWPCPKVYPYSPIYFYQFTNGGDVQDSQWTTRFTITSASGDSEKPEYDKQPNGDPVPWGEGRLVSGADQFPVSQQALSDATSQWDQNDVDPDDDDSDGSGDNSDEPENGNDGTPTDADSQNGIQPHNVDVSPNEPEPSSLSSSPHLASASSRHSTGNPTGSVSEALIPTANYPETARPARAQPASLSASAPNSSASCSQMGPGISNADNAVKLASAGCTREDRRWQGAASLYWFLAAMLL